MVEWRFPHHEWGYEPHKWRLVREWRIVGFASRDSLGQLQRSQKPLADGTFSVFSGNLFFQLYVFFVSLAIVESIPVAYYVLPEKDAQMYLKTVENLKSHLFHNIWYSLTHHRLGESSREDVAWYPKCLDEKVDGLKKKPWEGEICKGYHQTIVDLKKKTTCVHGEEVFSESLTVWLLFKERLQAKHG